MAKRFSSEFPGPIDAKKSKESEGNAEKNGWCKVSCLYGTAEAFLRDFIVPEEYVYIYEEDPSAKSDQQFLSLQNTLVISTVMLSKDVPELPKDYENITIEGGDIDYLPKGSRGVFFHLSQIDLQEKAKEYYHDICSPSQLDHMGTSQIFEKNGYMKALKPKIRYHCDINSLIDSFKKVLNIEEVEFRKFETVRYIKQWMYVVLVCPQMSEELEEFPIIEVGGKGWMTDKVIRIKKQRVEDEESDSESDSESDPDGHQYRYVLKWKPLCTRRCNRIWDHVTFLFYFPPKSSKKSLPLPTPYEYQHMKTSGSFGPVKESIP